LLLHLAANARNVVIAGAYAGDQALPVADSLRKSGGICHCFEPDREGLTVLRHNAEANGLETSMKINAVGLWDSDNAVLQLVGKGELGQPREGKASNGGETIAATTLNAYVERHGLQSVDLVMLDVEGGESAILRGASRYLAQPAGQAPNIVFEIHRAYVDWSEGLENTDIGRLLTGHGYKLYAEQR
jgi:FkbM family methyltransferase